MTRCVVGVRLAVEVSLVSWTLVHVVRHQHRHLAYDVDAPAVRKAAGSEVVSGEVLLTNTRTHYKTFIVSVSLPAIVPSPNSNASGSNAEDGRPEVRSASCWENVPNLDIAMATSHSS